MANDLQNSSSNETKLFDKNLNEDINDFHLPKNSWSQGRNAINNSVTGDVGKLGNEPANSFCISAPYPIIGFIHIIEDRWAVFSTNGTNSEIGLFIEKNCDLAQKYGNDPLYEEDFRPYYTIVNANCLNFSLENLIIGVSRSTSECTYKLYWDDGVNQSRVLEIDADNPSRNLYTNPESTIPWNQNCPIINGCKICTNLATLNCDKLRLSRYIDPICVRVEKGISGGNLANGSYFAVMAYAIKGIKMSDWYISNVQGLFVHENTSSSLDVHIDQIDLTFDEIVVGIGAVVNGQTVVRQVGVYSTRQSRLSFDIINNSLPSLPIEQLPIMTPIMDKSDAMFSVGDYLLRSGPTSKQDFNYQPLANQIIVKWQSVEYPDNYYTKGGNKTGYMRDEVYAFFIQWIYDTGDKSASYHIPGRPPLNYQIPGGPLKYEIDPWLPTPTNNALVGDTKVYETYNTAVAGIGYNIAYPDGGVLIKEGLMGYWESSEIYPDNKPQIWNASAHCWSSLNPTSPCPPVNTPLLPYSGTSIPDYDLCGKLIRHHKFPEDGLCAETQLFNSLTKNQIRVLGVQFTNVLPPRYNDGSIIPGIVGYNILRGSRNGNRTIVAKGIISNMREYTIPGTGTASAAKRGLFPNYPFNDLNIDPFLSTAQTQTNGAGSVTGYTNFPGGIGGKGTNKFRGNYFTFDSPDTDISKPYLNAKEFRIYGTVSGPVTGKFDKVEDHPKEKLITDLAFIIAAFGGIAEAIYAADGKKTRTTRFGGTAGGASDTYVPIITGAIAPGPTGTTITLPSPPLPTAPGIISGPLLIAYAAAMVSAETTYLTAKATVAPAADLAALLIGLSSSNNPFSADNAFKIVAQGLSAPIGRSDYGEISAEGGYANALGAGGLLSAIPSFLNYFSTGTDAIMNLIKSMLRFRDYALRYHSKGVYDKFTQRSSTDLFRNSIKKQQYISPEINNFDNDYQINNLYRSNTIVINTEKDFGIPQETDYSRFTGSQVNPVATNIEDVTNAVIDSSNGNLSNPPICSSHYGALKVRIDNQYGQLNNIVQIPIQTCYTDHTVEPVLKVNTLFGGDVYINRYTEKNTFFYFYDWLSKQPDGAQLDYNQHKMIPYPRYWANFNGFQTSDFTSSFFSSITSFGNNTGGVQFPSSFYALDGPAYTLNNLGGLIASAVSFNKIGWFYLFNSGVKEFFVESEINAGYRDYGIPDEDRFCNPYTGYDSYSTFKESNIKSGNTYFYDQSLSVSKTFINYVSWASNQAPTYNPYIAETCYVYQPTKLIYSLPSQYQGLKDGWLVFLPSNYQIFNNVVTCIKEINKSGALIFFDAASPVQFQGTDQLQTGLGTKLTIGDGGLFSQPVQSIVNTDNSYEYGSCQNRLSVINSPGGTYWISQNQGKIFTLGDGVKEISSQSLKWWFAQYLPYKLTQNFPDFQLIDNPVIGIGCQSMYNNQDSLLYFSKKDWELKPNLAEPIEYAPELGGNMFRVLSTGLPIELGDPDFFNDCSWTLSYDPKNSSWISYHDWHPSLTVPGKNTFMTVNPDPADLKGIWIHNSRCDLYSNYYDKDYPFEIEFIINTANEINIFKSVEYIMEVYKYDTNCHDRFHVLDLNFDEAVIYNTEQVSGLLKLDINPKNNPTLALNYPIVNNSSINILYSKVENKYRFNQFWDNTADRGQSLNPLIPGFAERMIWNTESNGYVKYLNNNNLDYNKSQLERKRFRHYTATVLLRRNFSNDKKIMVMLADAKELNSPR
jgi:hypothetical protein